MSVNLGKCANCGADLSVVRIDACCQNPKPDYGYSQALRDMNRMRDDGSIHAPIQHHIRNPAMTDSKMPERIWAADYSDTDGGGYWWLDSATNTGLVEYIRADLAIPAPVADAHRSFPEAADGRPLPPMGDELMTAGLNPEDARFVAVQLAQNGLTLVPAAPVADAELEALETGDKATLLIEAKWEVCLHGGGWWVVEDADGNDVLLSSTALRARTAQPVGVRVRKLEWEESQTTYLNRETGKEEPSALFWQANTILKVGRYTIMQLVDARLDRDKSGFRIEIRGSEQRHQTLEAAKAAAQADYEQRIRTALLPEGGATGGVA